MLTFGSARDVWVLRPVDGVSVEVVEPRFERGTGSGYQVLAPREADSWAVTRIQGTSFFLFADGSLALSGNDQVAGVWLRGAWSPAGSEVRLRARAGQERGSGWLQGYLSLPETGGEGCWRMDALLCAETGSRPLLARIRQAVTACREEREPVLPPAPGSARAEVSGGRDWDAAGSLFETLSPVCDVTVTPAEGFEATRPLSATLVVTRPLSLGEPPGKGDGEDLSKLRPDIARAIRSADRVLEMGQRLLGELDEGWASVTLDCEGPVAAGWVAWDARVPAADAWAAGGRIAWSAPPGDLPRWFAREATLPLPLRSASGYLEYSPADFRVSGAIEAAGTDGTQYAATVEGRLRSPEVEALRPQVPGIGLAGDWRGVLGPARTARVPGAVRADGHGELAVSADGELSGTATGAPAGFVRHEMARDLLAGLIGSAPPRALIILKRDRPVLAVTGLRPEDAPALARLAKDLFSEGFTATARPLLEQAAGLYKELGDTEGNWVSRGGLLTNQVQADFALRDYPGLLTHLEQAVRLRRRLLVEGSLWAQTARSASRDLDSARSQLAVFPPGLPRIEAAKRILEPIRPEIVTDAVLTADDAEGRASALSSHMAEAGQSLRELSAQEEAETSALLTPQLAAERAALIAMTDHSDQMRSAEALARAEEREERFRAAVLSCPAGGEQQRQAFLRSFLIAAVLRGLAARLLWYADAIRRRDLAARTGEGLRSTRSFLEGLPRSVEDWRRLLREDGDRIQALQDSQSFYAELVRLMLDLGAAREALLASELARARAFADLIAGNAPLGARAPAPPSPTIDMVIAASTRSGHTLVEYFPLQDELVTWLVRPDGTVTVTRSPVSLATITQSATELRDLLTLRRPSPRQRERTTALLEWLGQQLWSPLPVDALPTDPDEPVVVVPHGPLFRIPFSAIRDAQGRYLAQAHALIIAPAAAMLPQLRERHQNRAQHPSGCLALISPSPMPAGLSELTHTTPPDFAEITSRYDPGTTVILHGRDATISALRQHLPAAGTLILATHARAADTPEDPMDSFIALAQPSGHEGLLRARDVLGLDLKTRLTILSGCGTGAGKVTGDGVIGLSRSFLAAGSTAVLMTLYATGEEVALNLLDRFHAHWKGTALGAAAALRRALCEMDQEYGTQPHLWAPFALFGLDTTPEEP